MTGAILDRRDIDLVGRIGAAVLSVSHARPQDTGPAPRDQTRDLESPRQSPRRRPPHLPRDTPHENLDTRTPRLTEQHRRWPVPSIAGFADFAYPGLSPGEEALERLLHPPPA